MFAPESSSVMSRSRTFEPFIEYSLVPSRKTARSRETSSKSILNVRRELSKIIETEARFARGAVCEPLNIKSSERFPRILFIDCSPSANLNASATLLFPEPFGPTIAVVELEKSKTVFLAKDLNPTISSRFSICTYCSKSTSQFYSNLLELRIVRLLVYFDRCHGQFLQNR